MGTKDEKEGTKTQTQTKDPDPIIHTLIKNCSCNIYKWKQYKKKLY